MSAADVFTWFGRFAFLALLVACAYDFCAEAWAGYFGRARSKEGS
ncbi:MAG TPA: hypothetical protein VFK80_03195 [Limnochordia bacterium]|nr:hypothetical protein [Limnochordia bacterium]